MIKVHITIEGYEMSQNVGLCPIDELGGGGQ